MLICSRTPGLARPGFGAYRAWDGPSREDHALLLYVPTRDIAPRVYGVPDEKAPRLARFKISDLGKFTRFGANGA